MRWQVTGASVCGDSPNNGWVYGWMVQGEDLGRFGAHPVRAIRSFLEKLGRREATKASASGALWNTMVMTGRVKTFWALTREHLPEIILPFERLLEAIDTPHEARVLSAIYKGMPARNFPTDLLQRAYGNVALLQLEDVMWSNWGRAERIVRTLRDIGKPAACGWPLEVDGAEPPFAMQGAAR